MSSALPYSGSKKAAREVERVNRELNEIAALAQEIRDEAHLLQILESCPDDAQREAIRKLLENFLPFKLTAADVDSAETECPSPNEK